MPAQTHRLTNHLRTGQVSEALSVRTDWENRRDALLRAKNVTIKQQGGVRKRPGLRFVANVGSNFKRLYSWFRRQDESYLVAQSTGGRFKILNAEPLEGENIAVNVKGQLRQQQRNIEATNNTRQFSADAVSVFVDGQRPYVMQIESESDVGVRDVILLANAAGDNAYTNYGFTADETPVVANTTGEQPFTLGSRVTTDGVPNNTRPITIEPLKSTITIVRDGSSQRYGYRSNFGSITHRTRTIGTTTININEVYLDGNTLRVNFSTTLPNGIRGIRVSWAGRGNSTTTKDFSTDTGFSGTRSGYTATLTNDERDEWRALVGQTATLQIIPNPSTEEISFAAEDYSPSPSLSITEWSLVGRNFVNTFGYSSGDIVYRSGSYYVANQNIPRAQLIAPDQPGSAFTPSSPGPAFNWDPFTGYSAGSRVLYNGNYYVTLSGAPFPELPEPSADNRWTQLPTPPTYNATTTYTAGSLVTTGAPNVWRANVNIVPVRRTGSVTNNGQLGNLTLPAIGAISLPINSNTLTITISNPALYLSNERLKLEFGDQTAFTGYGQTTINLNSTQATAFRAAANLTVTLEVLGGAVPERKEGTFIAVGTLIDSDLPAGRAPVFIRGQEFYTRNQNSPTGLARLPYKETRNVVALFVNDVIAVNPILYLDEYTTVHTTNVLTNTHTQENLRKGFSGLGEYSINYIPFTNPPATYYDPANTQDLAEYNAEVARVGSDFTTNLPPSNIDFYGPTTDSLRGIDLENPTFPPDALNQDGQPLPAVYSSAAATLTGTLDTEIVTGKTNRLFLSQIPGWRSLNDSQKTAIFNRLNTTGKWTAEKEKQAYKYRTAPAGGGDLFRHEGRYVMDWNDVDGFPIAVGGWDTRLIFGGTRRFSNYLWASVENRGFEFLNRAKNEVLNQAREAQSIIDVNFSLTYQLDKADIIENIYASNVLIVFAQNSENLLSGRWNAADLSWLRSQSSSTLGTRGAIGLAEIDKQIFIHNGEEATALQYIDDQSGYRNINISGRFNEDIFLNRALIGERETTPVIRVAGGLVKEGRGAYQVLYLNEHGEIKVWHTLQDSGFFAWAEWDFFEGQTDAQGNPVPRLINPTTVNDNYQRIIDVVYHTASRRIFMLDNRGNVYTLEEGQHFDETADGVAQDIECEVETVPFASFDIPGDGLQWIQRVKELRLQYGAISAAMNNISQNEDTPDDEKENRVRLSASIGNIIQPTYRESTNENGDTLFSANRTDTTPPQVIPNGVTFEQGTNSGVGAIPASEIQFTCVKGFATGTPKEQLTEADLHPILIPSEGASPSTFNETHNVRVRVADGREKLAPNSPRTIKGQVLYVSKGSRVAYTDEASLQDQDYIAGLTATVRHKGKGPFELNRIDATVQFAGKDS